MRVKGFSVSDRLRSKKDFQAVFDKPFKVQSNFLLVLYRPNQQPNARLGIIISKGQVKLAVKRNKLRRLIRSSFRKCKSLLNNWDMIVMLRAKSYPFELPAFKDDVEDLWQRLNQSCKQSS